MRYRSARARPLLVLELCAAPIASLLVVLCIFLFPRPGVGDRERCGCGLVLGSSRLPRLHGPDRLLRATVLELRARDGTWTATVDAVEVENGPVDEANPDWKVSKLAEQLEVKRHNRRLAADGVEPPADLVLHAPGDFPAPNLRRYLYTLGLVNQTRVQLLLRGKGSEWYSAAYLRLVDTVEGCDALELASFRTYEELARAVVSLRREGRPARLAIMPRVPLRD